MNFFLENIFGEKQYFVFKKNWENIFWKIFFGENIFLTNIFGENVIDENIFGKNTFGKNIFDENIFGKNIVHGNILDENILGKNIFFSPFPHLTAQQTTPTSSQLLISDFWSWVWHNETKQTNLRTGRIHVLSLL